MKIDIDKAKETTIRALTNMRGDDTIRARRAFGDMSAEEMNKQHGRSGKTRAEILSEYEARDREIDAALAWIRSLP